MRIISKFKDYYDGLMDYSNDRLNRVWLRKKEEFFIPKFRLKEIDKSHFYWGYKIHMFYLVVAGKVYPVLRYAEEGKLEKFKFNASGYRYYFTLEDFDKEHPEQTRSRYNSKSANVGYEKGKIKDDWKDFFKEYSDLTELCLEFKTPVFVIKRERTKDKDGFKCITNINLKDIEFYKVMDPYTVYQELDMFMSNVMVNDEMPPSPMSDLEKIDSHGFDRKISFRKGKGE